MMLLSQMAKNLSESANCNHASFKVVPNIFYSANLSQQVVLRHGLNWNLYSGWVIHPHQLGVNNPYFPTKTSSTSSSPYSSWKLQLILISLNLSQGIKAIACSRFCFTCLMNTLMNFFFPKIVCGENLISFVWCCMQAERDVPRTITHYHTYLGHFNTCPSNN
jgi:hypothetical protein